MKKNLFILLIVLFAVQANAQTSDKKWGIGAGTGTYGSLKNGGIGIIPEFYLSRFLSPKFDLTFQSNVALFNTTVDIDFDFANPVLLNLRYKILNEKNKIRPYLFAGPGLFVSNIEQGANFDLGLGTKYYFSPNLAGYFQVGYLKGLKTARNGKSSVQDDFWKVTAGMELDFGKTKDSDRDGVSDKKDKCPRTPAGVAVDAKGCPVDSDGDGVADYQDDCPTVAGLVKLKGCPDKDKDGIADKDDACPDVAGTAKLKGCPDTDGDGIADKDDKCPASPKGSKVDASGCPLVVDTDKDGVPDSEDNCPTVAGTKENKGCPAKPEKEVEKPKVITLDQVELQNIKVGSAHFVSGKSYLTDYSKGILDKLIKILNQNKDFKVNVYGYSDSNGSDELNLKLSQERIFSVIQYLESKGISSSRIIKQEAFGAAKPAASNATPEGRLLNRRVEFELFKMK